jgi:hypothetical protein
MTSRRERRSREVRAAAEDSLAALRYRQALIAEGLARREAANQADSDPVVPDQGETE